MTRSAVLSIVGCSVGGLGVGRTVGDAQQERFTLATAAAQCGGADAAAAAGECQRQVQGDPGTGHSQWGPSAVAPPVTLTLAGPGPAHGR